MQPFEEVEHLREEIKELQWQLNEALLDISMLEDRLREADRTATFYRYHKGGKS